MLTLLPSPFGNEDTRIRPRALRLAHPFATLSLPRRRAPCGDRRRRAFARPASSRTRVGPFAGDGRCVHHHRRVFVTRAPVLAEPLRALRADDRRCVWPTSAHPRIRKRAPIASCGDRVSRFRPAALRRHAFFGDRCGRCFHDTVRASVARDRWRSGVFFPSSVALVRATSDAPVAGPGASRRDFARDKASGSAEIVSAPHVVKTYGAPRSEASSPTRRESRVLSRAIIGNRWWRCHFDNDTWSHPRALVTSSCTPARMPAHVPSTAVRRAASLRDVHPSSITRTSRDVHVGGRYGRASIALVVPFDGYSSSDGREETSRGAVSRCREEGMNPGSPLPDTSCHPHEDGRSSEHDRRVRRTETFRVRHRRGRLRRTHREPR